MNSQSEATIETLRRSRVLVVEDEPLIAENLRTILVDAGFEVAGVAAKVEAALAQIADATYDVAIVDANLAGVSAAPAASALSARGLPFIVLSGYTREQLQSEFAEGLFIQKPYRIAQLINVLNSILLKE
jgi:DNA-binding response OmpR family regulator